MFISSSVNFVDLSNVIIKILRKHPQKMTYPKKFIRVCAVPILLSLVYNLQKNMIISPIELCNPSVADPDGALDFDIFLEEHDPGPL